MTQISRMAGSV